MVTVGFNTLCYDAERRGIKSSARINCKENKGNVRKQLEVDFVANLGNRRYYIQSAYAIPDLEKMQQEQSSLLHVPDSFKKIIVVGTQSPIWRNEQGITIMSIYDFLLNENSLDV